MTDAPQPFEELTRDELIDLLRAQRDDGIKLNFSGRDVARHIARKVQPRTSRRIAKYSVGSEEEQADSQVIEGENLQAMVTLYRERGQVDLILADPPYNTGKDFRYNDRWEDDPNDPDLGQLVPADEPGRHTKWMRFMWPRLKVMRDMLKPGGVLAICIDYRELFRLGAMLDDPELFGEENRLAVINWQKSYAPKSDKTHVSTATEYVLVYAKSEAQATTNALPRTEAANARYKNTDGDSRLWKGGDSTGPGARTHQGMVYGVQSPFTGEIFYPQVGNCWRSDKKNMKQWLEGWGVKYTERALKDADKRSEVIGLPAGEIRSTKALVVDGSTAAASKKAQKVLDAGQWPRLFFGMNGQGRPQLKNYLEDVKQGFVPTTYWANDDYDAPLDLGSVSWAHQQSGHSQTGIDELDAIVGKGHGFETVKPLKLFKKIIQIWAPQDGLVVDPFAGSGTTGHAVLALNNESGSHRRFILIEQGRPEKGDAYARSLLAKRLQRAITGEWANGKGSALGGGFRFCQMQTKVDAKALLEMERDEMTDAVIASHYDVNRRGGPGLIMMTNEGHDYLVARNASDEGFFLVWDGSQEPPVFDDATYEVVVNEAAKAGLKPTYHVYARFNFFQSDDVRFYQIPDQILLDFGLNVNDSFNNDVEAW